MTVWPPPSAREGGGHCHCRVQALSLPAPGGCYAVGHSAFLTGTPSHGSGIVVCAGGAGCPLVSTNSPRFSEIACDSSRYSIALNPCSLGFGVVVFWQPQVPSMLRGYVAAVSVLPLTQLFVLSVLKIPPANVMSPV